MFRGGDDDDDDDDQFLEAALAEAMEHAPLQALLEAMDAQMAALEAASALAEEARLTPNRLPLPPPSSSPLLPPPRALQPPRILHWLVL